MNSERITEAWKQKYNLAKIYYEHYGDIEIPKDFKTLNGYEYDENGICLGRWILAQRNAYNKTNTCVINQRQIELLNMLGMRWNCLSPMDKWNKRYNLAKIYYEHYGNLEIPRNFKTLNGYEYDKNGFRLGTWLIAQKEAYNDNEKNIFTPKQIELLNQIGIVWDNVRPVQTWMESYNLAKKYYEHYQNLNIPKTFKTTNGYEYNQDGMNLGIWLANQRKLHKAANKSEIWKQQIELLNQIHMDWKADTGEMNWMKHYSLAKIYYEHYGNSNIPSTFKTLNGYEFCEEGFFLGKWLSNQRQSYKGIGTFGITEEKIRRLEEIKIRWFTENCDLKLQKEDVNQNNKNQKQIEILNRVRSFLVQYDSEQLPSKEEVNQKFLNELDKNLVKRK